MLRKHFVFFLKVNYVIFSFDQTLYFNGNGPEITVVRDVICTANPSQIFVQYHFYYDLIEFKM